MAQPPRASIREVLLAEIKAQQPTGYTSQSLQQSSVLNGAASKLGVHPFVAENPVM